MSIRLVPVANVRDRMYLPNATDVNTAISDAIETVTDTLESLLRTKFGAASITDTFRVRFGVWSPGHPRCRLLLTRGFMSALTVPSIKTAQTISLFNASQEYTFTTANLADWVIYDYERGVVDIVDTDLSDYYVRVTYDAGFNLDGGDPTQYDQTELPSWLVQAAELATIIELAGNPAVAISNPENAPDVSALRMELTRVLGRHIRYVPTAITPITSEGSLYSLGDAQPTYVWATGEELSGSGTTWTSAHTPVGTPIVQWGGMFFNLKETPTLANEFGISGTTWTFVTDLGADPPVVWYQYAP